jgi:EAL domain-containing protein (putative c-di-GMP-specific phosphodiesterase class I)
MFASDLALLNLSAPYSLDKLAIPEMLHILRKHLDMDIAFLGEFNEGQRTIRQVDTDEPDCLVHPGLCTPEEESYCKLIIDGKLPYLMNDINDYPVAEALYVTQKLGIRSYISAPIRLSDGMIYGTLCCYSHTADPSLNKRDLALMHACAEMTAKQIDVHHLSTVKQREAKAKIKSLLTSDKLWPVYQPIYDLSDNIVVGFEALLRSRLPQAVRTEALFNEAHEIGLGYELEIKAVQLALEGLDHIHPDVYIAVNVSPDTVLHAGFLDTLADKPLERITLEITEHAAVEHYHEIKKALAPLRGQGMQLAVDDAGAGFSSFRHILELSPDRIKLDWTLTKDIETDPGRRALVAAFVQFSHDTGSKLIAEGVETLNQLQTLHELGIEKVQGNYLGFPLPLDQAAKMVST